MNYSYPEYAVDLSPELVELCCDTGLRVASEVGLVVRCERFLDGVRGKPGVRIEGDRVHFDLDILQANFDKYVAKTREGLLRNPAPPVKTDWRMSVGGVSMALRDIETDEIRQATQQDLRDSIKLMDSFGIGGNYPVVPQDLPPLMRGISCFKICWESSDSVRPYDYLDKRQLPFLYEMHQVMEKPFDLTLCVCQPMMIDDKDLDIFLEYYPRWKRGEKFNFQVLDYPMLGITKPVSLAGSMAMYVADMFSVYTLFNTFDPEIELSVGIYGGLLTDLRHACWAWGHPRQHLMKYLNSRIGPAVARVPRDWYMADHCLLETASSSIDEQAALEKMGGAMIAVLQGCRSFGYVGSLCVDDLFSGVQFVIDVEMVNYIREAVEAFDPHPDVISIDEKTYALLRDVCLGKDEFIASEDTVIKFRNIMPSSDRLVREKLRAWMAHGKTLKDRAREECIQRISSFKQTFHLPEDKQRALEDIYARAEKELSE